jgi:hypothetical protein
VLVKINASRDYFLARVSPGSQSIAASGCRIDDEESLFQMA